LEKKAAEAGMKIAKAMAILWLGPWLEVLGAFVLGAFAMLLTVDAPGQVVGVRETFATDERPTTSDRGLRSRV